MTSDCVRIAGSCGATPRVRVCVRVCFVQLNRRLVTMAADWSFLFVCLAFISIPHVLYVWLWTVGHNFWMKLCQSSQK